MEKFEDVAVVKTANIYFDGSVTSRTVEFGNGETKTLGIILPGEYHFETGKAEVIEIQLGDVEVLLAGSDEWQSYSAGQQFSVPGNSSFNIKTATVTDYCCSFVD
jgi:purine/pyrimidine-nucleoside phosphorylase